MDDESVGIRPMLKRFVGYADVDHGDRAAVASLRRSAVGPHGWLSAAPYVMPFIPPEERLVDRRVTQTYPVGRGGEWEYFVIAGLFGIYDPAYQNRVQLGVANAVGGSDNEDPGRVKGGTRGRTIGDVLRELKRDVEDEATKRRFLTLLAASKDDLPFRLRQVMRMARTHRPVIPINFERLFEDLRAWEDESQRVQLSWASRYFQPGEDAELPAAGKQGTSE